jgi:3-hydroxyisobutyrate dehydrogenase
MNIAIIGAGEVGRTYAKAVAEQSVHTAILCDPYPTGKTLRFVSEAGLELHRQAGTWLADTDRVWLCVTGDLALPACRGLLSHLRPAAVIVDLTTASPGDKQTASHLAAEHHIQYVDTVILGAIALTGAATPLLAAGPARNRLAWRGRMACARGGFGSGGCARALGAGSGSRVRPGGSA